MTILAKTVEQLERELALVEASLPPATRHVELLRAELRAIGHALARDSATPLVRASIARQKSRARLSLASAIELVDVLEQRRTMLRQQIKEGGRE